ncbi:MAG: hypothetical protein EON56_01050 [Alphaproteobacteria bacterium]|nr:MAG: hypothetical protein EON56_01050 [Alphaproteobacteria bacterium]
MPGPQDISEHSLISRLRRRAWKLLESALSPLSDRAYLSVRFRRKHGRWPEVTRPRSFSEHILAYKLRSRGDQRFVRLADKAAVKTFIAERVGEQHVIPTLWSGSTRMPPRHQREWPIPFVIKGTHGWNSQVFVTRLSDLDWDILEPKCESMLRQVHGRKTREWHYSHIEPGLIVEAFIGDAPTPPNDIKLFVFAGRVELIEVDQGRYAEHSRFLFDREWRQHDFQLRHPSRGLAPPPPRRLHEMIVLAEKLAKDLEFVRVDLYDVPAGLFVGELTFFPGAGDVGFKPVLADYMVGRHWKA